MPTLSSAATAIFIVQSLEAILAPLPELAETHEAPQAGAPSPRKAHALHLFEGLPRHYDLMGAILSFGQDPRWRRAMVGAIGATPTDRILDVAAGTGMVSAALVRRYGCSVVGLDQSAQMLDGARAKLAADPELASRIELVRGQAEQLPFADGEFDHLTFTYLWRYLDDPAATMRELARVVKPGGRIASLEFGVPSTRVMRAGWRLHTRLGLPLAGRIAGREWYEVGRFLGPSIEDLYSRYPLEQQAEIWRGAGIGSVQVREMSLGAGVVIWGVRDSG